MITDGKRSHCSRHPAAMERDGDTEKKDNKAAGRTGETQQLH